MIILSTSRMTLCGWRDRKELFNCEVAYIYYIKPTTSPPQLRQEGEPLPPLTTETSMASVGAAIRTHQLADLSQCAATSLAAIFSSRCTSAMLYGST